MKGFLALAKISFLDLLLSTTGGKGRNGKGKSRSGWMALLLLAFIMVFISGNYSFMLASVLGPMGGLDVMLMVMILAGILFSSFLTLYLSQSLLFSAKDIDLVLSLPVSSFSVLLARLMALYLEILFMVELFLIPCGVAWLMNGGGGGVGFMVLLMLAGVFLSFIPAFFSLVFGSFIGLLISKTRFKNLFTTLLNILFLVAIMFFSFGSSGYMETLGTNIEPMRASLLSSLPPLGWLIQALTGPQLLLFLLVAALCVLPFFLLSLLISRFYKKMLTSLLSQHVRSDYRLGAAKTRSSFSALMGKEARRFFGTPAYLMNSGIGMILMLLGAGALLFFKASIQDVLVLLTKSSEMATLDITGYVAPVLLAIVLFFLITFEPSAVSISLEGKNLWILKEAPLNANTIFFAKAGFHFVAGAVCTIPSLLVAGYALLLPWADTLLILLLALSFLALNALTGVVINLKHPRLDADNDTIVVKQSASTLLGMLTTLLQGLVLGGLYFLLVMTLGLSFSVFALLSVVVLLAGSAALALWLRGRGAKLFLQLS